jgi:hypothetical protein
MILPLIRTAGWFQNFIGSLMQMTHDEGVSTDWHRWIAIRQLRLDPNRATNRAIDPTICGGYLICTRIRPSGDQRPRLDDEPLRPGSNPERSFSDERPQLIFQLPSLSFDGARWFRGERRGPGGEFQSPGDLHPARSAAAPWLYGEVSAGEQRIEAIPPYFMCQRKICTGCSYSLSLTEYWRVATPGRGDGRLPVAVGPPARNLCRHVVRSLPNSR